MALDAATMKRRGRKRRKIKEATLNPSEPAALVKQYSRIRRAWYVFIEVM